MKYSVTQKVLLCQNYCCEPIHERHPIKIVLANICQFPVYRSVKQSGSGASSLENKRKQTRGFISAETLDIACS
jgi:hypothetical protein